MDILVSVLCITFLGNSGFVPVEPDLKSEDNLFYMFNVNSIKTDSQNLGLESKDQPHTNNEENGPDEVPTA